MNYIVAKCWNYHDDSVVVQEVLPEVYNSVDEAKYESQFHGKEWQVFELVKYE
jgi:hypothetical protein